MGIKLIVFCAALATAAEVRAGDLDAYLAFPAEGGAALAQVYQLGQARGNYAGRLSRVGDSISANGGYFLSEASFDKFSAQDLREKADFFRPNFGRRACEGRPNGPAVAKGTENGCAAYSGKTIAWLLAPADGLAAPVDLELAEYRPAYAVVLIGTNDLGYSGPALPQEIVDKKLAAYQASMRELVRRLTAAGTIPILTTLPPRTADLYPQLAFVGGKYAALLAALNGWLRAFAAENQYPLIDLHGALCRGADPAASLTACGLGGDGVHPGLEGYDLRNRLTMQMLYRVSAAAARN
jgi:lysophospholipase L1-like esterase